MERVKTPKRLVIDLTHKEHKEIKARAVAQELSIKDWVMNAILDRIEKEDGFN